MLKIQRLRLAVIDDLHHACLLIDALHLDLILRLAFGEPMDSGGAPGLMGGVVKNVIFFPKNGRDAGQRDFRRRRLLNQVRWIHRRRRRVKIKNVPLDDRTVRRIRAGGCHSDGRSAQQHSRQHANLRSSAMLHSMNYINQGNKHHPEF